MPTVISAFNRADEEGGKRYRRAFLLCCKRPCWCGESEGAFDVTIGPLVNSDLGL